MWSYICPICNHSIETTYTSDEIKDKIEYYSNGCSFKCTSCNGLLTIDTKLCVDKIIVKCLNEYINFKYSQLGEKCS